MRIHDITWERIHLHIAGELEPGERWADSLRFYLVSARGTVETAFEVERLDEGRFRLSLNVTNSGINRCIRNGTYKIYAATEDGVSRIPCFYGTSETLAGWSRSFNYRDNKGVYSVTFMVDEYSEKPELQLLFYNAESGKFSDRPAPDPNFVRCCLPKRIMKRLRPALVVLKDLFYRLLCALPRGGKKRVLFLSEKDEKLALNMAAIYERMRERGLDKSCEIRFSLRNSAVKHYSALSSMKTARLLAWADVILVDDHVPLFDRLVLGEKKTLIQVWHAGAGFKGVGYSRWGHYGCPGPFSCHRQYSYCICDSQGIAKFFSEQFGILDEQIIPTGMPRMDRYVDPDNRRRVTEKLYAQYPQLQGKKIILFAPTYRGQDRQNAFYPYELIDCEELYRYCCENNAAVLFKMHPWVQGAVPIPDSRADRFINMNGYPNINELFYVTDLLITDYSSSMYEFLLMRKPMLFFAFDKNQFATSRGFHRDYDTNVPGKVCESFAELMQAIRTEDYEFEKVEQFHGRYLDYTDGGNCDRVIDWLILGRLPERYRRALEQKREEVRRTQSLRLKLQD